METKDKKIIQMVIVLALLLAFWVLKTNGGFDFPGPNSSSDLSLNTENLDNKVIFSPPLLSVFGEKYLLNEYPDKIIYHYPYLIIIIYRSPDSFTTVYDLEKKEKVLSSGDIGLDYRGGDFLFLRGQETYFNNKKLKMSCSAGLIISGQEILCLVREEKQGQRLVKINIVSGQSSPIYESQRLISSLAIIAGRLYLGELDLSRGKSFLRIEEKLIETPSPVDLIYPLKDKVYFASIQNSFRRIEASYYLIGEATGKPGLELTGKGWILLFEKRN